MAARICGSLGAGGGFHALMRAMALASKKPLASSLSLTASLYVPVRFQPACALTSVNGVDLALPEGSAPLDVGGVEHLQGDVEAGLAQRSSYPFDVYALVAELEGSGEGNAHGGGQVVEDGKLSGR